MGNFLDFIKSLKRKPQTVRQNIYFLVIFIFVPLVILLLAFSLKNGLENSMKFSETKRTFGQYLVEKGSIFFAGMKEGVSVTVSKFWQSVDLSFFREFFGRPKVETIEPGKEIILPKES